jgi:hypothetical protein
VARASASVIGRLSQRQPVEQPRHYVGRLARADLGDIARLPRQVGAVFGYQREVPCRLPQAARVQQPALHELPSPVAWALPVLDLGPAAQRGKMVLPVPQRAGVAIVDFDHVEQRLGLMALQPAGQRMAEGTEARVAAVAQRQDAVAQLLQRIGRGARRQLAREAGSRVRGVALARGADQEQRLPARSQLRAIEIGERQQLHRHARALQRPCGLCRQLLGKAGLAGVGHQRRFALAAAIVGQRGTQRPAATVRADHAGAERDIGDDHARRDKGPAVRQHGQRHARRENDPPRPARHDSIAAKAGVVSSSKPSGVRTRNRAASP